MERSTSKETATKMVKTVATDHVGVKANDLVSCTSSTIFLELKAQANFNFLMELKFFENYTNKTHNTTELSQPIT